MVVRKSARHYAGLCKTNNVDAFVEATYAPDAAPGQVDGKGLSKFKGQPKIFLAAMALLAMGAAVQGMDETVINGAQLFFLPQFGILGNPLLEGLVNGAPYLCCAILGCWLTIPINNLVGRRMAIIIASAIQFAACIGQACTKTWQGMLAARLILGLGIGINSATVPMFAAEVAPAHIRGAIGMLWQFFTAFGIMLGNGMSLAFLNVPDSSAIFGLRWRLMMGSPAIFALLICIMAPFCPDSPRWLMQKGRHEEAFKAMCRLRSTNGEAARDCYHAWRETEEKSEKRRSCLKDVPEMLTVARDRRVFYASELVMFTQQFCGVNLIAYYSTMILKDAHFTETVALVCSLALGMTNFLFAIPAFFVIDKFGRRPLMLGTLPFMAIFLMMTGAAFFIPETSGDTRIGVIMTGLLSFMIAYSPGPGPVPFPYCAEAWSNKLRPIGMALNTATTWGFNFLLSFTFPLLRNAISTKGVFFYYGGWCLVLEVLVFCLMRETKGLRLEQVEQVFLPSTWTFVTNSCQKLMSRVFGTHMPEPLFPGLDKSGDEETLATGDGAAVEKEALVKGNSCSAATGVMEIGGSVRKSGGRA